MNGAMEGGAGQFQFRDLIERIKQQVGNDNERCRVCRRRARKIRFDFFCYSTVESPLAICGGLRVRNVGGRGGVFQFLLHTDIAAIARDASQLYGPQSQDMAGCPIARCLEN